MPVSPTYLRYKGGQYTKTSIDQKTGKRTSWVATSSNDTVRDRQSVRDVHQLIRDAMDIKNNPENARNYTSERLREVQQRAGGFLTPINKPTYRQEVSQQQRGYSTYRTPQESVQIELLRRQFPTGEVVKRSALSREGLERAIADEQRIQALKSTTYPNGIPLVVGDRTYYGEAAANKAFQMSKGSEGERAYIGAYLSKLERGENVGKEKLIQRDIMRRGERDKTDYSVTVYEQPPKTIQEFGLGLGIKAKPLGKTYYFGSQEAAERYNKNLGLIWDNEAAAEQREVDFLSKKRIGDTDGETTIMEHTLPNESQGFSREIIKGGGGGKDILSEPPPPPLSDRTTDTFTTTTRTTAPPDTFTTTTRTTTGTSKKEIFGNIISNAKWATGKAAQTIFTGVTLPMQGAESIASWITGGKSQRPITELRGRVGEMFSLGETKKVIIPKVIEQKLLESPLADEATPWELEGTRQMVLSEQKARDANFANNMENIEGVLSGRYDSVTFGGKTYTARNETDLREIQKKIEYERNIESLQRGDELEYALQKQRSGHFVGWMKGEGSEFVSDVGTGAVVGGGALTPVFPVIGTGIGGLLGGAVGGVTFVAKRVFRTEVDKSYARDAKIRDILDTAPAMGLWGATIPIGGVIDVTSYAITGKTPYYNLLRSYTEGWGGEVAKFTGTLGLDIVNVGISSKIARTDLVANTIQELKAPSGFAWAGGKKVYKTPLGFITSAKSSKIKLSAINPWFGKKSLFTRITGMRHYELGGRSLSLPKGKIGFARNVKLEKTGGRIILSDKTTSRIAKQTFSKAQVKRLEKYGLDISDAADYVKRYAHLSDLKRGSFSPLKQDTELTRKYPEVRKAYRQALRETHEKYGMRQFGSSTLKKSQLGRNVGDKDIYAYGVEGDDAAKFFKEAFNRYLPKGSKVKGNLILGGEEGKMNQIRFERGTEKIKVGEFFGEFDVKDAASESWLGGGIVSGGRKSWIENVFNKADETPRTLKASKGWFGNAKERLFHSSSKGETMTGKLWASVEIDPVTGRVGVTGETMKHARDFVQLARGMRNDMMRLGYVKEAKGFTKALNKLEHLRGIKPNTGESIILSRTPPSTSTFSWKSMFGFGGFKSTPKSGRGSESKGSSKASQSSKSTASDYISKPSVSRFSRAVSSISMPISVVSRPSYSKVSSTPSKSTHSRPSSSISKWTDSSSPSKSIDKSYGSDFSYEDSSTTQSSYRPSISRGSSSSSYPKSSSISSSSSPSNRYTGGTELSGFAFPWGHWGIGGSDYGFGRRRTLRIWKNPLKSGRESLDILMGIKR